MTGPVRRFRATIGKGKRILQEIDGAGDVIHEVVKLGTFGLLGPCAGCDERREWANEAFPNPFRSSEPKRSD